MGEEENTEKNSENTEDKKTSSDATDGSENTENTQNNDEKKEDKMIPKDRFDEVNTRAKTAEDKLKKIEEANTEAEKTQLTKDKKFKELSTKLQAENDQLKLDGTRRDLIQDAIKNKVINEHLTKMVTGNNEEEIKKSIVEAGEFLKEVNKGVVDDNTASDDSGSGKQNAKPMSDEEFTKLMKDDPEKADEYLRKMTP